MPWLTMNNGRDGTSSHFTAMVVLRGKGFLFPWENLSGESMESRSEAPTVGLRANMHIGMSDCVSADTERKGACIGIQPFFLMEI